MPACVFTNPCVPCTSASHQYSPLAAPSIEGTSRKRAASRTLRASLSSCTPHFGHSAVLHRYPPCGHRDFSASSTLCLREALCSRQSSRQCFAPPTSRRQSRYTFKTSVRADLPLLHKHEMQDPPGLHTTGNVALTWSHNSCLMLRAIQVARITYVLHYSI